MSNKQLIVKKEQPKKIIIIKLRERDVPQENNNHSEPVFKCFRKDHTNRLCQDTFTAKSSLNRHIRSVHDKESIVCEICGSNVIYTSMTKHRARCLKVPLSKSSTNLDLAIPDSTNIHGFNLCVATIVQFCVNNNIDVKVLSKKALLIVINESSVIVIEQINKPIFGVCLLDSQDDKKFIIIEPKSYTTYHQIAGLLNKII